MSVGATASTYKSVLGIAKEATPGTPVAASAFIPVRKLDPKNAVAKLADTGWRGSMVDAYNAPQVGVRSAQVGVSGDAFPDTVGWYLAGMLGDVATTGASAPFTHTMALLNSGNGQPTAYTLTDSTSLLTGQFTSSRITDFKMSYDASKLLTYDATYLGWAQTSTTAPTQTYSTLIPAAAWQATVSLGGSATAIVHTAEVDFKRDNSECVFTLQNVQDPYEVHVGPLVVTGKFTYIAAATIPLTDYTTNVTQPLVLNLAAGAGPTATQIQLTATSANYTSTVIDRSKSYLQWQVEAKFYGNTTDVGTSAGYSPCKVTLQNALPAATYV